LGQESESVNVRPNKSTLTISNDPRLEGLPASGMQVACIQDLNHSWRASVAQKSFACIRQHGLSGFAYRCPRRPLRASVSETTLACIHFEGSPDTNMCIRTSETSVFTTGFLHLKISPLFPDLKWIWYKSEITWITPQYVPNQGNFLCLEISFVLFTSKNSLATGDRVGLIRWTPPIKLWISFLPSPLKERKKETNHPFKKARSI